ncbi:ATP-binding protein [Bacteroides sp. AN502(2024)]|uniref:ATP-binding protein n=1 Tax=Bacteroides sp. AN502(2024) TaxID=3160599 RepID=UPI003512B3FC
MKTYIPRPLYTKRIEPFIDKELIKVITGQRRIGKSYILLQISDMIKKEKPEANIIFVDKEQLAFVDIKNYMELYQYVLKMTEGHSCNYLFVDEIQEIEDFQLCLRSLLNENRCDIYCTGSNAKMLSGELATHLAGRYIEFPVHSLSYEEFLTFNRRQDSSESLKLYLTFGGMPYIYNLAMEINVIFEYLRNVYSTILLKDVVAREAIRNVSFLENLVAYLIDNTGSLFSAQNISKYLKSQQVNMPTQTILNYLRALCNSFFIYKIQRAEIQGMKIFEIGEKYYFEDLGLHNAIRRFDFRKDINKLMENVVCIDLLRFGYEVYVGKYGNKEIDFIASKSDHRIYIQVTYMLSDDTTIQREFGNLLEIPDNYPKYVVTMDEIQSGGNYRGIKQISLRDFLLAEDKENIKSSFAFL